MKQKKSLFLDTSNLAIPELHLSSRSREEDEDAAPEEHRGKHHLHSKSDAVAVPEVKVEDD